MQLLDGKATAKNIKNEIAEEVKKMKPEGRREPHLVAVLVGHDGGSESYVSYKMKDCEQVGFKSSLVRYEDDVSEEELLKCVHDLNNDDSVDGFIVQLPLPKHIPEEKITLAIDPDKDVDGFHPYNLGRLAQRLPALRPCTPKGVMTLLEKSGLAVRGLDATVVGASNIVGRPMALELMLAGCTTTVCHRFTQHLDEHVRRADLLVVAVGKPGIVKGEWIKPGAIVIDVGINRGDDGRLIGDIDFDQAQQRASHITPVPGGVGPMTVASLLQNTLESAEKHAPAGT